MEAPRLASMGTVGASLELGPVLRVSASPRLPSLRRLGCRVALCDGTEGLCFRRAIVYSRALRSPVSKPRSLRLLLLLAPCLLGMRDHAVSGPVISEILAGGAGRIIDADGQRSDWIEIHNPTPERADLSGYYLTDDFRDLRRWRFPAPGPLLEPGAFLVVLASGKDRREGEELHTNFKLALEGEPLALVAPDGETLVHAYAPAYPRQRPGISYGVRLREWRLVGPEAPAQVLVPASGALGDAWMEPDFAPGAGWIEGRLGAGYDEAPGRSPEGLVSHFPFDSSLDDVAGGNHGRFHGAPAAAFVEGFDGKPAGAVWFDGADDYIEVTGRRGLPLHAHPELTVSLWVKGGPQADRRVFSEGSSSSNTPVFNIGVDVSGASGKVDIFIRTQSGELRHPHTLSTAAPFDDRWRHLAWVDSGGDAALYVDGRRDPTDFRYQKPALPLDRTSIGAILRAGPSFHFRGAIDEVSLWSRALGPEEVAALAAGSPPSGLATSLGRLISSDIGGVLRGVNASAYVRVPFLVPEDFRADSLTLEVWYDDGFAAYLNGVEVARRNAPAALSWSSSALSKRSREDALRPELIDLTSFTAALAAGANVLAIHGLNAAADDEDFLIRAELRATALEAGGPAYFLEPTPGRANGAASAGLVAEPRFSVERGFFERPFTVAISSATPEAIVRYTTDGSEPSEEAGIPYAGPIAVAATATLRAAAFRDGWIPSAVATQTYIFPADVLRQRRPPGYPASWSGTPADYDMDPRIVDDPRYAGEIDAALLALPAVSVVMPLASLFGPAGIYENPLNSGRSWERRASLEVIFPGGRGPDGSAGLQVDAGARISGNRSRHPANSPKHGLRFAFRGDYGASRLEARLLPDSPAASFDTLVFKPHAFDSWVSDDAGQRRGAQYQRDQFVRDSQRDAGHPTSHGYFVHLYLNGLYWGVYNLGERPDGAFGATYWGGEKDDWDAIKNHEEVVDGTIDAYRALDALRARDLRLPANYAAFRALVDLENLADYMIVNMYAPATDWPGNYYMLRERREGATFKFVSWDAEYALLGGVTLDRTQPHWRDADSPTKFYHAARANPEFRQLFGDRLHRLFFHDGALAPAAAEERWMARARELETALIAEAARWGDYRRPASPYRPDVEWRAEQDSLRRDYLPRRSAIVLEQFRAQGMYPSLAAPELRPRGGPIAAGFRLEVAAPAGLIYYTLDGGDPRLEGGGISPAAIAHRPEEGGIPLEVTSLVRARAHDGSRWSALEEALFVADTASLRITELMFHPRVEPGDDERRYEFIELQNTGERPLNLAGVRLQGGVDAELAAVQGPPVLLPAGEVALAVRDAGGFVERYPSPGLRIVAEYRGSLSNRGELIVLEDALGRTILSFTYSDAWQPLADGRGRSLEVVDPRAAAEAWSELAHWRASEEDGGTPGRVPERDPEPPRGGRQLPGDITQDGRLDISDAVALLKHLFAGDPARLPCGEGGAEARAAQLELADVDQNGAIELTDAVRILVYLFQGGAPPALGTACRPIAGCPDACGGE
jgi:hypothetical protein